MLLHVKIIALQRACEHMPFFLLPGSQETVSHLHHELYVFGVRGFRCCTYNLDLMQPADDELSGPMRTRSDRNQLAGGRSTHLPKVTISTKANHCLAVVALNRVCIGYYMKCS